MLIGECKAFDFCFTHFFPCSRSSSSSSSSSASAALCTASCLFLCQHNNYSWVVDEKEKARSSTKKKKKKKKLVLLIAWCSRHVTGIHSRYIFHSKELNRITSRKLSWNYIICFCSDAIIYSWKIRDELRNYSTEFINDKK